MKITQEDISNAARELQRKRWAKISKKDRIAYSKMMNEAKRNKKKLGNIQNEN